MGWAVLATAVGWALTAFAIYRTRDVWSPRTDAEIVRGRIVESDPSPLEQTYFGFNDAELGLRPKSCTTAARTLAVTDEHDRRVEVTLPNRHVVLAHTLWSTVGGGDRPGSRVVRIHPRQPVRVLGLAVRGPHVETPYRGGPPPAIEPIGGEIVVIETESASAEVERWRARVRKAHVIAAGMALLVPPAFLMGTEFMVLTAWMWPFLAAFGIGAERNTGPWWLRAEYERARRNEQQPRTDGR
jgi:hypothetical protein